MRKMKSFGLSLMVFFLVEVLIEAQIRYQSKPIVLRPPDSQNVRAFLVALTNMLQNKHDLKTLLVLIIVYNIKQA